MPRPKGSKNKTAEERALIVKPPVVLDDNGVVIVNRGGRPPKYDSPEKLDDAITDYFTDCTLDHIAPTWHDMLLKLRISDSCLLRYRNNEESKYSGYAEAIKRAEHQHCNFWQRYALDHPNLQSFCIFELKQPHNGGFIDRPQFDKADMTIKVDFGFNSSKAE